MSLSIKDLRNYRRGYNASHIEEFSQMYQEGNPNDIPRDFGKFLARIPPTTPEELDLWLYVCLVREGLSAPFATKVNDLQPEHNTPFSFISDSYFGDTTDCIVLGNRAGGKTLAFAALLLLESIFKPNIELAHLGSIKDQATKCYRYFKKMIQHPIFAHNLRGRPLMGRTELANDSVVEILTGTVSGVNSPHPVKAQIDEVELMDWSVLQEAFNMASSKGHWQSATRLTSTRKYSSGTMQRMLDEADSRGFVKYNWNIFDVCDPCPIKTEKTVTVMIPTSDDTEEERPYTVFADCPSCPAFNRCKGRAKYSHGGAIPLSDLYKYAARVDWEVWESQHACARPGKKDLIIHTFDERFHVIPKLNDPPSPVYAGQDAGFGRPATIFVSPLNEEEGTWVVFDELYESNIAPSILTKEFLVDKNAEYNVDFFVIDPSGLQLMAEMEVEGLYVVLGDNSVEEGLDHLNSLFSTNRLFVTENCVNLIYELKNYKRKKSGTIRKEDDHLIDSLRYVMMETLEPAVMDSVYK